MGTHPNAILMLSLTPDDATRKTYRELCALMGVADSEDDDFKIGGEAYRHLVMEEDYEDSYQITDKEGNIVVFDMFTYGYGDRKEWGALEAQKAALEAWAKEVCPKLRCSYTIYVTANYW